MSSHVGKRWWFNRGGRKEGWVFVLKDILGRASRHPEKCLIY